MSLRSKFNSVLESVHPLISKYRHKAKLVKKSRLRLVFSTCLSVFRNQRKNTYSCLNYYVISMYISQLGLVPRLFARRVRERQARAWVRGWYISMYITLYIYYLLTERELCTGEISDRRF